ncbi:MAG: formate/nitrite transporter family protein [Halothece sp.]
MDYTAPPELIATMVKAGESKARLSIKDLVVRGFYSGSLLGIATTLAITMMTQTDIPILGALIFPWAFVGIVLFGMELVTGNFALLTAAMLSRRARWGRVLNNWLWVYLANFLGCLFVALLISYSLTNAGTIEPNAVGQKIMAIAESKTLAVKDIGMNGFLLFIVRGILCNWLVCLAVMFGMVSKSVPGKFMGCWFPIMAFVALGFEHIVVNMFFITTGMILGAPISGMDMVFWDFLPVTIGNLIGGCFFVGFLFHFTHKDKEQLPPPATLEPVEQPVFNHQ